MSLKARTVKGPSSLASARGFSSAATGTQGRAGGHIHRKHGPRGARTQRGGEGSASLPSRGLSYPRCFREARNMSKPPARSRKLDRVSPASGASEKTGVVVC